MALKQGHTSFPLRTTLCTSKRCKCPSIRTFTSSGTLLTEAIPAFTKTSSPRLNELLHTIRHQIFLPGHLPRNQRALIQKQKYHHILRSEAPLVQVGEEQFRLEPSTPWKDVPNHWVSVLEALKLMESDPQKWRNFTPLILGMHGSGKRWKTEQMCKIIRIVGEKGSPSIIMEALKRSHVMGVSLSNALVVREAMWACRMHAVRNKWEEEPLSNALRYAIQVGEILDQKLNAPVQNDPRTQPDVLGVIVELAAARAVLYHESRDEDGLVKRYTERLVSNLEHGVPLSIEKEGLSLNQLDSEMLSMISLRNALLLAEKILGSDMPNATIARTVQENLDKPLRNARKAMHRGPKSLRSSARRSPSWLCDSQRFTKRRALG